VIRSGERQQAARPGEQSKPATPRERSERAIPRRSRAVRSAIPDPCPSAAKPRSDGVRSPTGQIVARPARSNSLGSLSFSVVGVVGVLAVIIAGATTWLVLTDPVTVAESVDSGEVSPLVRTLATTIFEALRGLLKYL
jgi:hypothetical protein